MTIEVAPPSLRLLDDGAAIEIRLSGGPYRFHAIWLRDNAQDAATRSPGNGQRLITLSDLPAETRIADAHWWGDRISLRFEPDDKVVDYDPHWLLAHAYDKADARPAGWTGDGVIRWDAGLAAQMPVADYAAVVKDGAAGLRWLQTVRAYGFARLTGAPTRPGVVCEVAALFGYVRQTNYGRAFDVRAEFEPSNLAYTNLGLQAHTDNPYRDPTPGLQLLACLRNTVAGGESIVVDGFKVAERLQAESPLGFELLTGHCARFEYAGVAGVRLHAKRPLLELGPDGELLAVRFNNRSAAPFTDIPFDRMADYYRAYRLMARLVDDEALTVGFKLAPGDLFIVDNLRVLHGRRPIVSGGERWLQGCYADRDGLLSTLAVLEADAGSSRAGHVAK